MIRRSLTGLALLLSLAACGASAPVPRATATPVSRLAETASTAEVDSLWARGPARVPPRQVGRRHQASRPGAAGISAGGPARPRGALLPRRGAVRDRQPPPGGPRVPAGLGRHAERSAGARGAAPGRRRLCRPLAPARARPVVRPDRARHLPGAAQPLSGTTRRPSGRRRGSPTCRSDSRTRNTRRRSTTSGSRPTTRRSCTSRTWWRTYPRAAVAPDALVQLVQAYRMLGYKEDVQETCGYIRRFHPRAAGSRKVCPDTAGAS